MKWKCWSCQTEFEIGGGISLDDSDVEQICEACWDKIPVSHRVWMGFLFRQGPIGGSGLRELINAASSLN